MKTIETILGPISPDQMRICLPHEHFNVYGPNEAPIGVREHALALIVPQLQELRRRYDCNALVECTATGETPPYLRDYRHIFTHVMPRLKKMGVTPDQIRQIFYRNPKTHLCGPW